MSCSTTRNVRPRACSSRMCRSIVSTITGFTPAAGSSSSTRRGSPISSDANSSSLRWPNDSDPARSRATRVEPELLEQRRRARARLRPARLRNSGATAAAGRRPGSRGPSAAGTPAPAGRSAQAGAGEPRRVGPTHRATGEGHRARVGRKVAGDQVEGGRLPRAVRADQGSDGALRRPRSLQPSTAATPPKRFVRPSTCEQRASWRRRPARPGDDRAASAAAASGARACPRATGGSRAATRA